MTTKQTVMWTALPNGVRTDRSGAQWLLVSAFMSPRLESTVTPLWLGAFPDFVTEVAEGQPPVNWASTVGELRFSAAFKRRTGTTITVPAASIVRTSAAVPELWAELFNTGTPVKGYLAPDVRATAVTSFAMKRSSVALRDHISAVASLAADVYKIPLPEELITPTGLPVSPLTEHLVTQMQSAGLAVPKAAVAAAAAAEPTIHETFSTFHQPFNSTFLTPEQRLIRDAAERETDFHKAITALGNYPVLLPLMGIVVNLEVPITRALLSDMGTVSKMRLIPVWPDAGDPSITRIDAYPWTMIEATGKSTSLGYKVTSFRPKSKEGDISKGYLVVRDTSEDGANDPTVLSNIDVDLALGRMFTAFDSIIQQISSRVLPEVMPLSAEDAEVRAAAEAEPVAAFVDATKAGFPTLGQPVLALSVNEAGTRLKSRLSATADKNALLSQGRHADINHYAEELARGYRVDVWDSVTKVWHPLCQRLGTYRLGDTTLTMGDLTQILDEGWVQLAPTSSPDDNPQAPAEMRLHEQLFTWNGWSLVVQRPGAALAEEDGTNDTNAMRPNTMKRTWVDPLDPSGTERLLGEYDNPNLPLWASFQVPTGTLPRLRLGTTYRFRARWVDLAGNSIPFEKGEPTNTPGGATDASTTVTRAIVHKRYEPIKPPTVVLTQALDPSGTTPGETPLGLVVRSNYNTKPLAPTSRHICPPRTSFTMAEAHGAFDLDTDGRPMDASLATWQQIADRDAWDFPYEIVPAPPEDPDRPDRHGNQLPMASIPAPLPYLADVPSRGASFTGLPGQKTTGGNVSYTGRTPLLGGTTIQLADGSTDSSAALRIPFAEEGSDKADRRPFKLVVKGIEGTDTRLAARATPAAPTWSESARTLDVQLPKAEQITVELSSFANANDVNLFGTYQWAVTKSIADNEPQFLAAMVSPEALSPAVMTPKTIAMPLVASSALTDATNTLINVSVLGNNWTITPHDSLTLVHAVQQPMIAPNSTSYLTAVRAPGSTTAVLRDWVQIHGKSTARLVMDAYWREPVDKGPDTETPLWGATAVERKGQAFDTVIDPADTVALSLAIAPPDGLTMPVVPKTKNRDSRKQRHALGDTKHHYIKYTMTAASRFQHYFPPETQTNRTGNSRWRHVPSTARPLAPKVDLVIPAFKWVRNEGTTTASSVRGGGRLRVYLERPWFTSGADEKLAVLLWQSGNNMGSYDTLRPYITEWGNDPVYRSLGSVPVSIPTPDNFQDYAKKKQYLFAAEHADGEPLHVTAMVYDVQFDPESDRWFADIKMNQGNAYFPFVKLALARYQQYSLPGLELSTTAAVDAVQLAPDRSASVALKNLNTEFEVTVSGRSYIAAKSGYGPLMTMSVETRAADGFAWVPVPGATELRIPTYVPLKSIYGDTRTYWRRAIGFKGLTLGTENRIVIREYEKHVTGSTVPSESLGSRPVYVDVLPLVQPAL